MERFDIGRRAGKQQAVDVVQQILDLAKVRQGRDDHRQPEGRNADSAQILVAADMVGVQANLFDARCNTDQWLECHFYHLEIHAGRVFPELISVDFN